MKNALTPLAKRVFVELGLTAAASETDAAIQKKIFQFGTTLIILKKEMGDKMKTVKTLKKTCLLTTGVSETIRNEAKEQPPRFLGMLLGKLVPSVLGSMLAGKIIIIIIGIDGVIWAGEGVIRAGQDV